MDLAQQNLFMLKRLTEKKSEYSVKKMEEHYKKVQNYKKIMCNFPCINFNKPKRGLSSDSSTKYRSEMNQFFPTINYINDGYLEKVGKKIKDKKRKEEIGKSEGKEKVGKIEEKKENPNEIKKNNEKEKKNEKIMEKELFDDKNENKKIEIDDKIENNKDNYTDNKKEVNNQKEECEIDLENEKLIIISRNNSSVNEEKI
jgi:hypothetical protein